MVEDAKGFLYPQVDSSVCIECGLCEKVCPLDAANLSLLCCHRISLGVVVSYMAVRLMAWILDISVSTMFPASVAFKARNMCRATCEAYLGK